MSSRPLRTLTLALVATALAITGLMWNTIASSARIDAVMERALRVEVLRGTIVRLDEVLTMSARMAAATGDPEWEARYRLVDPQLTAAITEAQSLAPTVDSKDVVARTEAANTALVQMEHHAFDLVRQRRLADARAALLSDEYARQKGIYAAGMDALNLELKESVRSVVAAEMHRAWIVRLVSVAAVLLLVWYWIVALRTMHHWRVALLANQERLSIQSAELAQLNAGLDHKVAERTAEVESSRAVALLHLEEAQRARAAAEAAEQDILVANQEVKAKESEYRRLISNLPDVTWSASADGRILYSSPNVEHVLGYTAEDYCERGEELWLGRIHPADSRRVLEAFGALFNDNRPFDVEYRIQHKNGEWIWIHDRAIRTYVKDGVRFADGIFSDVTARRRLEEALKEMRPAGKPDEEKDRLLVEEIPALTYMVPVDPPGRPIYVSPQATARLGIAVRDWSEVPDLWRTLVHPEDRDRVDAEIAEVVKTGRRLHLDYRMVARDDHVVWVHDEATLAPGKIGEPRTLRGVLVDISDVKAAEEAVQASERRYRLVAENVSDVIWTADLEFRRTYVSPSITRVLGYDPADLEGKSIYATASPAMAIAGRKVLEEELAAERAGRTDRFAARVAVGEARRKDGSTVWVEVKTSLIRDRSGQPVGILGLTRDITERRQAEQAKADFITFATHQLRTPLTGIKWLLEIAALQPDVSPEMSSYLGGAQASANRMIALVNDLLDATRLERQRGEVKTEPTDLAALTRSLLEEVGPLAGLKRQRLSVHDGDGPVIALAEPALLRQAVINLVANAIKFTPEEGIIDIRLSRREDEVRWEIQDNGIGIPAVAQEHLFEKFYRADNAVKLVPEGTGLGLHLVRLIIDQFGGRVWFQSEEGRGTTFTFTLPTPNEVSSHG